MSPTAPPRPDDTPWSAVESSASLWLSAFGALLLGWGWWEASGSAILDDQTGSAVIAILGTGASCFGLASWLRAGRRAVDARRHRLMALAGAVVEDHVGAEPRPGDELLPQLATADVVTYPGAHRHHRSDCLLVIRKPTSPATAEVLASTRPCEMCRP
jgi:hypothetical protein